MFRSDIFNIQGVSLIVSLSVTVLSHTKHTPPAPPVTSAAHMGIVCGRVCVCVFVIVFGIVAYMFLKLIEGKQSKNSHNERH